MQIHPLDYISLWESCWESCHLELQMGFKPVAMAEWIECLLIVQEVYQLNPGILPLLHAGRQVLHQRWIWCIRCWDAEEACKQEIHTGFEIQGIPHQKSKTGVSVAPQKELMFSKELKKEKKLNSYIFLDLFVYNISQFQISFL